MVLFYGSCCISILLAFWAEKKNRFFPVLLIALILSIVCGFRSIETGTDTKNYYNYLNQIVNGRSGLFEEGFEEFIRFLYKYLSSVQLVIFAFSLITSSLIVFRLWELRKLGSFPFMIFIYFSCFYPQSFNIVRQYLALAIVFWATRFIDKKRYIIFLIFVLIATLFHTSAVISVGLLYLQIAGQQKKYTLKKFLFVSSGFLALMIFAYLMSSVLLGEYGNFFRIVGKARINLFTMIYVFLGVFYFIIMVSGKKGENYTEELLYTKFYIIGLFLSVIGFFMDQAGRLGLYYSIFQMPFVAFSTRNKKVSYLYKFMFIIMPLYNIIIKVGVNGESGIMPYVFQIK